VNTESVAVRKIVLRTRVRNEDSLSSIQSSRGQRPVPDPFRRDRRYSFDELSQLVAAESSVVRSQA